MVVGYVTIDIEIIPSGVEKDAYFITATTSAPRPIPKKTLTETITFDFIKWADLNTTLKTANARAREGTYGKEEEEQVKGFGTYLFQQIMTDAVYSLYTQVKNYANRRNYSLRFRLHLSTSELMELPWETLYDEKEGYYLGLAPIFPRILLTRCPIGARLVGTVPHPLPLHIMMLTANPPSFKDTEAEEEERAINKALVDLIGKGDLSLHAKRGTDVEVSNIVKNGTLDIVHFIGHGRFSQEGELVLEDVRGAAVFITANKFSLSLPDSVKLVFLNACDSARMHPNNPFSSIAYTLAKQGPGRVVIAMQFKINNSSAICFANIFYSELARGRPVDEAVAEARRRVFILIDSNPLDWASPVLYMKSTDGVLFKIEPLPSQSSETEAVDTIDASEEPLPILTDVLINSPKQTISVTADLSNKTSSAHPVSPILNLQHRARRINRFRRKHPLLSILTIICCILLISATVIISLMRLPANINPSMCNTNSVLYPQSDSSESATGTFVNVNGIKDDHKDIKGDMLGLSAGTTVFDVNNVGSNQIQQAAGFLQNNDTAPAQAIYNTVSTDNPTNAEARIYAEDFNVLNTKLNYIVVVLGLSASATSIGNSRDNMQGAYLAQTAYNQAATQNNCPALVVVIANSGSDETNATEVANQILELKQVNSHIIGVVGWPVSAHSINANKVLGGFQAADKNIVMVSPDSSSDNLSNAAYLHRMVPSDTMQTQMIANYAYNTQHYKKVAILYTASDNYSVSSFSAFDTAFKQNCNACTIDKSFNSGDSNSLNTALTRVLEFHPDAIYFAGYAADAGLLLALPQIQSLPPTVKILGGDSLAFLDDFPPNTPNMDRLIMTTFAAQDEWQNLHTTQLPGVVAFLNAYHENFHTNSVNTGAILTYDAVNVLLQSYRTALSTGTLDCLACELQNALKNMHGSMAFQGISGQISFASNGSADPLKKIILIDTVKSGALNTFDARGCFSVAETNC